MMPKNCKYFIQHIAVSISEVGERIQSLSNYYWIVYKSKKGNKLIYRNTATKTYYILKRVCILNF